MKLPDSFRPNENLEEKTKSLVDGANINNYEELDSKIGELIRKDRYSLVTYENLEAADILKAEHSPEFYSNLICEFRYGKNKFQAYHCYEKKGKEEKIHIVLFSSEGESIGNFKKVLKMILKFNKKMGTPLEWNGKITKVENQKPRYDSRFQIFPTQIFPNEQPFKNNFLRAFGSFYNKRFQDARITLVLTNITEEELRKAGYPKEKISAKLPYPSIK